MTLHRRCRPGFTLLEMMVVISIIALLAALSVTAVFRVQQTQREVNTNHTLRKAQIGLDQQRKAAQFLISKENPTNDIKVLTSTDGLGTILDNQRARALHTKLRMKQEFPQNYAEARYTFKGKYSSLNSAYGPKTIYSAAIGAGSDTPEKESAALLMITLSLGRGGVNFNIDEIGPTQTIDVGGKQIKVLIDEWGTPICMRRWVLDDQPDILTELNDQPFVTAEQITNDRRDPDDPERKLKSWGMAGNGNPQYKADATLWFTEPLLPKPVDPFNAMNRGPYLVSAGKDKVFGTADDMYSFRIQGAGRGGP